MLSRFFGLSNKKEVPSAGREEALGGRLWRDNQGCRLARKCQNSTGQPNETWRQEWERVVWTSRAAGVSLFCRKCSQPQDWLALSVDAKWEAWGLSPVPPAQEAG